MSAAYLKYYFAHDGKRLFLDSLACMENEVSKPDNFLKWYEEGDLAPVEKDFLSELISCPSDTAFFQSVFTPRKVTFSVDEYLEKRANDV